MLWDYSSTCTVRKRSPVLPLSDLLPIPESLSVLPLEVPGGMIGLAA